MFYSPITTPDTGKRSIISYILITIAGAVVGVFAMYVTIALLVGSLMLLVLFSWLPGIFQILGMIVVFLTTNIVVIGGIYLILKKIELTKYQKIVFFIA